MRYRGRIITANAAQPPAEGCPFAPRCLDAADACWSARPADTDQASGHPDPG